ncbi:MAG: type IV secretion protein DotN [Micavibrio sp.]|nr:type IV secretion protein DotN [Micavibrio sp.]|tara:strand:- start:1920 stop:2642 length:723 start_codon:yes stop_codon:yes gene_type:complete
MDFYPITLGVDRPLLNAAGKHTSKKAVDSSSVSADGKVPADIQQKIFERDKHTCQCCGFQAQKYQEILFKDMNKANLADDNLLTACIFCHQCFYLDKVSTMRSGVLVWMPDIEQARLHHIARAIYVARISQGPVAEAARKSLDVIMERREEVKRRLFTDDPHILSTVLYDYLSSGQYKMRTKKLEGVRLFPLDRKIVREADLEFNQFPQILAYWRSKDGPFGGKTPPKWITIYQEILSAA